MMNSVRVILTITCLVVFYVLSVKTGNANVSKKIKNSIEKSAVNLSVYTSSVRPVKQNPIIITINNLTASKSQVFISFYTVNNKFLNEDDVFKGYKFVSSKKSLTVKIYDLKYDDYSIATYQDVNNDHECNRNLIGIPTEPYGFSNNFKPSLRAPHFDECKFSYSKKPCSLTINMIN